MQVPIFVIAPRSYQNHMIVAVRGTQIDLIPLLQVKHLGLEGTLGTMKDFPTCIQFVGMTDNKTLGKNEFRKSPVSHERTGATMVSNVYKMKAEEALLNQRLF